MDGSSPAVTGPLELRTPSVEHQTPSLEHRTFRGSWIIGFVAVVAMCTVGLNVVNARKNLSNERLHLRDFGVISAPAKTAQVWKMQPNGMVATFTSVGADASTVKSIRRHMRFHRLEYLRANYSDLKFGNQQIRGRADLEFGTGHNELNCRYRDVPGGGELRWITKDSVMLDSLKEWATAVGTSPVS